MHVSDLRAVKEERDVGDILGLAWNVTDSGGRDGNRLGRKNVIHDREIVNCQVPNHVDVVLEKTEINAHRIVVIDLTQFA